MHFAHMPLVAPALFTSCVLTKTRQPTLVGAFSSAFAVDITGPAQLESLGGEKDMTCDRCGKSTQGVGYVMHSRHRDDPEDYRHVLCHECNPAYEQERDRWQESHPLPSV